ncbi:TetR/AcrR family transcriptional regulator [Vogesella sp. LIG4]|uniref:TetR/AcrR family transcriptional regulator n=1 Tax=Vogesella sp. LIG4 TaxID=1192162 RepID=UPI00081FBC40|nr:TetR/AcrR family transcriptional regulator [Vogesella sp. LIG4]SCK13338.1 transcriptional regulator, TetR family [Vogesella sp. LIG4]
MSKKSVTRETILQQAVALASASGIAALTIGELASASGMSKSGLFAHFGSKEALQLAVVEAAQAQFVEETLKPVLQLPRGLPRLSALFDAWVGRLEAGRYPGGCPLLAACYEFDDQPGVVRDALMAGQARLREALQRMLQDACEQGELPAGSDPALLAFMLFGLVQSAHHDRQLLGRNDAEQLARRGFALLTAQGSA